MIFPTDLVEFTDEEGYGRYLDLHDCYLKYINLKSSEVSGCCVWAPPVLATSGPRDPQALQRLEFLFSGNWMLIWLCMRSDSDFLFLEIGLYHLLIHI